MKFLFFNIKHYTVKYFVNEVTIHSKSASSGSSQEILNAVCADSRINFTDD